METVTINTKLREQDYIRFNYQIYYGRWTGKVITCIGLFSLLCCLFLYMTDALTEVPWIGLAFGVYFTLGVPMHLHFAAKKNFRNNKRLSEAILYGFEPDRISVTGESFQSTLSWNKIYSITENKDWVLIWQNPQVANIVPKRGFRSEELHQFKELAKNQEGFKNQLKYIN